VHGDPALNLAQQQVVDLLGAAGGDRPSFEPDLADHLRTQLERGLAQVVAGVPDEDPLYIRKYDLAAVHGCEVQYLANQDEAFAWSVPKARGTIVHKAIQVGVSWSGTPNPVELVTEAIARAANGTDALGDWLRTCGEYDRADLASQAVERVTTFLECFPPLKPAWRPNLEFGLRAELFDGRIVLIGRPDLSLGTAQGSVAGKVIVDFKTGAFSPSHLDDLRFYALLDTLKVGTPPRLVAGYYLDQGRALPEAVGVALLESAVARTIDGVQRVAQLHEVAQGRADPEEAEVARRTGPACRWCALRPDCPEGQAFVAHRAEADGVLPVGDRADDDGWS
jgi:hypothetical protein